MIALDTNVLVRYFMMDDADQSARAAALVEKCAEEDRKMFLSHVVLSELFWVLSTAYSLGKEDLGSLLSTILKTAQFEVEESEIVHRALSLYQKGRAGFADFLLAEKATYSGCNQVASFDRRLLADLADDCGLEP